MSEAPLQSPAPAPAAPTPPATTGSPAAPQAPSSPSPADPAASVVDPAAAPAADPAAEALAAARAVVPGDGESYAINAAEEIKPYLGGPDDPGLKALQGYGRKLGWDQGQFDDTIGFLKFCADEGLLGEAFDPAKEVAALGDNGKGRMQEAETFLNSVKDRGEIDDGMYGEFMGLAVTANGVKALEWMRKQMGPAGQVPKTPGEPADPGDKAAQQQAARDMANDPRYRTDPQFKRAADEAYKAAFS